MSKELDLLKEAVKMLEEKEKANKVELATLDCGDAFKLAGHDFIVLEHEILLTSVDMQNEFESCKCKVRPISFDEAREFNNLLVNKDLPDWYWTITPWST